MTIVESAQWLKQRPERLFDLHHLHPISIGDVIQHNPGVIGIPQQGQNLHQNLRGLSVGVGVDGIEQLDRLREVQSSVFDRVEGHFGGVA